jgi:Carboxypeptidase regulatory-like domain
MRLSRLAYLAAVFAVALPVPMSAQATLGSAAVSGTVRDESGAAIPAAKVTLVETSRGLSRDATTNETGGFLYPTVSAGIYSLTVTKVAFETHKISDVRVEIGDRATLDVVLKVGQVSSVVSVSAGERMLLETESNALGTVIDSERVESLPLNGRSFLQLALSAGGANTPVGNSNVIQAQTGHPDRAVILTGNMPQTTGYLIDGIATRGGRLGESAVNISVAAIDQFKVQQSFFMPDQGPNPGLVNVTTKGGGNDFHGQAFEYVRNKQFDARNYFAQGPEDLKRNQFGGALGGRILRDKLWFFGYYEGLRQLQAFSSSAYTPTAAMFGGDFNAIGHPIYDPDTYSAATGTRQPFANNSIPANRINAVSTNLLKYYLPGSSLAQRPSNLFGNPKNTLNDDQWGIRIDSAISSNQTLYGQFIHQNDPAVNPGLFPFAGAAFPNSSDLIMLQHTWNITPTFINTVRAGFIRNVALNGNQGAELGHVLATTIGVTGTFDDRGISGVTIQGYSGFGRSAGDLGNIDNSYQLDDGINLVHGHHNLQFGGSIRYRRTWQQNANAGALGNLSFQPLLTAQVSTNAQGQAITQANTGDAFADFLLGDLATGNVNGLPRIPYRFTQYMPYFGDTWKVARTLTINYGISWFLATPADPQKWARQLPHSIDPNTGLLTYAALNQVDPRIVSFDKNNLAPRLGIAWSPSFLPHTVIRAGAGFYYADSALIEMQFAMVAPPFNTTLSVTQVQTNPVAQFVLGRNVFSNLALPPLSAGFAASLPNGTNAFLVEPNSSTPYIGQWNFSIQHTFGNNNLVEADYLGNSSHRLQDRYDADQCRATASLFCDMATKPFARYSGLLTSDTNGNSSYEAMVLKFHHRASSGLNFNAEYTLAKALTDGWESGGSTQSQITICRRCDKGPASFNQRQHLSLATIYDLPFGRHRMFGKNMSRGLDLVAGGWTVSAITSFATGVPIFLSSTNRTGSTNITHRPNRVCDGRNDDLLHNLRTDGLIAFDTSCFVIPPVGFFGNAGRDIINSPGANNWDIGFQKFFTIVGEQKKLEFRAEMFNAFNHANFGQPNANVADGLNFGRVSSAAAPRLIQLGMKFLF